MNRENLRLSSYHQQKQYAQALPLLKRALAINEKALGTGHPEVAANLHNLAQFYHAQGEYVMAKQFYQRALAIREQSLGLEHPFTALTRTQLSECEQAMGKADIFYLMENSAAMTHYNSGVMYGMLGQTEKAITEYRAAIALDPDYAAAHYNLGCSLLETNAAQAAKTHFEHTIRCSPKMAEAYFMLGSTYGVLEQWARCAEVTQQGLTLDPDAVSAYNNLGLAYNHLGLFEDAIEALTQVVAVDKQNSKAYLALGKAYRGLNRHRSEYQAYLNALNIDSKDPNVFRHTDALLHLGAAYLKRQRRDHQDIVYIETKGTIQLNDPNYWFYSALGSLAFGQVDMAKSSLPHLQKMAPSLAEELQTYINRESATEQPNPEISPDLSVTAEKFTFTGKQFNSPRNKKRLRVEVSGPISTNAVNIWAEVQALGEFCFSPASGWALPIPNNGVSGSLASGKAHCPEPAGYLSVSKNNASANIDVLKGVDISSSLFDKTRIYVDLQPAGKSPTPASRKNKVFEIGGSQWLPKR